MKVIVASSYLRQCVLAALAVFAAAPVMATRPIPQFALDPNPSTYRQPPSPDTLIVGAFIVRDTCEARVGRGS